MSNVIKTEYEKGEECALIDCPSGPFLYEGKIHFCSDKEAYCGETGGIFWGSANSHAERTDLRVVPLKQRQVAIDSESGL